MVKRGPRHFGFRRTSRRVKNVDIQTSWALVSPELRQPFVTRVDTGIGIVLQVPAMLTIEMQYPNILDLQISIDIPSALNSDLREHDSLIEQSLVGRTFSYIPVTPLTMHCVWDNQLTGIY